VLSTPFLNISGSVSKGSEQGLLGLAFHPSFKTNRKLYVNFTRNDGDTVIREYRVSASNPNVVDTSTKRRILIVAQPYSNHNGGGIAFGPDGYLYIGMGDGGGAGDPQNRARNLGTLLGKMLRIDVNGTSAGKAYRIPAGNPFVGKTGLDEIWQYGLRNPWRWSFDRITGTLWIGDVGQDNWEEIDYLKAGTPAGTNFGWSYYEGTHVFKVQPINRTHLKFPAIQYPHSVASGPGNCAVTGGYVYRGTVLKQLRGYYVYADFCSGRIWKRRAAGGRPVAMKISFKVPQISSFGEGRSGGLYVISLDGSIYKMVPG